jgi:hypothetical protein
MAATVLRSATIEVFTQGGADVYLNVSGELFGPYPDEGSALDAIPGAMDTLS